MGQLPICCCSKAKKFNDFSRARLGVYVQGASRRSTPSRGCTLANLGQDNQSCSSMARIQTSGTVRHTELSPTGSETSELIGNPRPSQQLMDQLPICCCSKAKKFNDFSRARLGVYVQGARRAASRNMTPNHETPVMQQSLGSEVFSRFD